MNNEFESYCLASSSSGNAYIFKFNNGNDSHSILVECGLPYDKLQSRAIQNQVFLSDCEACLITHYHKDHACSIKEIMERMPVFASEDTFNHYSIEPEEKYILKEGESKFITPTIKVLPFPVVHDAYGSFGFCIGDDISKQVILFINDCKTINIDLHPITFDYVFIECNYLDQPFWIEFNKAKKECNKALCDRYQRIHDYHMSLKYTIAILKTLDLSNCKAIFLMHLSDKNAREKDMKLAVQNEFPNIKILVCQKNGGVE